ncbi:MAG TPA: dodecin family protein [Acidimicrobiales bacterium]
MSIAKVIEISASSSKGFEDAITMGIARASETIHGIEGAWVKEQKVLVTDNQVTEYRVNLAITFKVD